MTRFDLRDLRDEPDPSLAEQRKIAQRIEIVRALKLRWYPDFVPLDAIDAAFGGPSAYTRKKRREYQRRRGLSRVSASPRDLERMAAR